MVAVTMTDTQISMLDFRVVVERGPFDLDVEAVIGVGEVVAVMGPNGAGKTTLLEALLGSIPLRAGWVILDGQTLEAPGEVETLPTHEREIGMVFQDGLLFPHLNVLHNVEFGARDNRDAVAGLLEALEIEGLVNRYPGELSAGQRQRVALARTLATRPRAVLLDEPLAALDISGRARARRLIGDVLRSTASGALIATHDPADALAMADRVLVLENGRVTQFASHDLMRTRPASGWVAELMGYSFLEGLGAGSMVILGNGTEISTARSDLKGHVAAIISPTAVALYLERPSGSPRNSWQCRVESIEFVHEIARVSLVGPFSFSADVTRSAVQELGIRSGDHVWASVKATEVVIQSIDG